MADNIPDADAVVAADERGRERRQQDQALDSLTDMVEEKEVDSQKVQKAMSKLLEAQKADREEQLQRERALAAVKVSADDIATIATEFELDKKVAERKLRENQGDAVATLRALLAAC